MKTPASPKVSIVIPCYNSEAYLEESITCALEHDYENLEVIVVNDGSTDGSEEIIQGFSDRIKWVRTENQGISAARNLGIEMASGKYLQFLDSDDLILAGKIQRQVKVLEETGGDAVISDFLRLLDGKKLEPLNFHRREHFDTIDEFVMYNFPLVGRCLYTASITREVGGFGPYRRSEDFVFHFKLIGLGAKWIYSPENYFLYRVHQNENRLASLSSFAQAPDEHKERIRDIVSFLKENHRFDDAARKALSYDCYRQAVCFYRIGMRDSGDSYLKMSKDFWNPPVVRGRRIYELLHRTLGARLVGRLMASSGYGLLRRVIK